MRVMTAETLKVGFFCACLVWVWTGVHIRAIFLFHYKIMNEMEVSMRTPSIGRSGTYIFIHELLFRKWNVTCVNANRGSEKHLIQKIKDVEIVEMQMIYVN